MTNLLYIQHNNGQQVTVENINSVVDQIGKLYDDTAKSILGLRLNIKYHTGRGSTRNTYREQKPWFNDNCKKKRAKLEKFIICSRTILIVTNLIKQVVNLSAH